jgi:DNA-3-methyladenine glycosylase
MAARSAAGVPSQGAALTREPSVRGADWDRPLRRSFFARPSPVVARDLLGQLLVRRQRDVLLVGRIVETEAYQEDDPASHSFGGPRGRNLVMFGDAGHLYVYFTYGMHFCMNVVTGRKGEGSAVLLRAAEPIEGLETMRARRGAASDPRLCAGPARLAQAYGVGRECNGADLVDGGELWVGRGLAVPQERVAVGPRVGIRRAVEVPWRFADATSGSVSGAARIPLTASRPAPHR